jgi:hypothetical protein
MTGPGRWLRTCAGCTGKFRPAGDERYCTATCAARDGQMAILRSLQRFADQQALAGRGRPR